MRSAIQAESAPKLQIERLKELYATNRCARALLNYAAKHPGGGTGPELTMESLQGILRLEEKTVVKRRELTRTLRVLAEAGGGRFVAGRHGSPSRFGWATSPAGLARAIVGGESASALLASMAPSGSERGIESGMFSHAFRLRKDLVIRIQLPGDLAVREADRLARFIQTLPIA